MGSAGRHTYMLHYYTCRNTHGSGSGSGEEEAGGTATKQEAQQERYSKHRRHSYSKQEVKQRVRKQNRKYTAKASIIY